jgi:hypothetical protein
MAFVDTFYGGKTLAEIFLGGFGGKRLIHGHTPISAMANVQPADVRSPLIYAEGLCINVDGGMYLGGPGFVFQPSAHPITN